MDKNAIKKYAVWARQELISRVSQKAYQYGIRENDIIDANADSIDGKLLTDSERKERQALIAQVKEKGFEQVMEEVTYTWFNRFSALRFMEINGYLPSHVRVFTDDENNFKPQIITEAIHMELDGLDMNKVYAYVEADNKDELYKYLLITQCNALNKILPGMFQKIADYTELLFPDNLLREGSVIQQMIALIPEDDWKDAVQIIGWLYQYYNSEPKDIVFANLKKNIKITKENIPAATQLFTPDWIVRYMVENSLGRLWLEGHPNDELKSGWKYYLDEAQQEADVQAQIDKIHEEYKTIKPEGIRLIDPCMGSGHILVYAFDVLMQIYETYGYNQHEAAKSIVENNLYGLDIDDRAAQLAYFAVMMKARQYDRRFFSRDAQSHVYAIRESNHLDSFCVDYFVNGDSKLKADIQTLIDELQDAKEYGSILNVTNVDFDAMYVRFDEIRDEVSIEREAALNELLPFVQIAQTMAQKYDVVITNPPYMGSSGMSEKISTFVKTNYAESKNDLFAVFIDRCGQMTKECRYQAMITQHAWMFLSSFEKLRNKLLLNDTVNMAHLGARAFEEIGGEVVQTTTFVMRKQHIAGFKGMYVRLIEATSQAEKEDLFLSGKWRYQTSQDNFLKVPGTPIAYWVSKTILESFDKDKAANKYADFRHGMSTSDNNRFLRYWFEVSIQNIGFNALSKEDTKVNKWFIYLKGGSFRRWYGNYDYLVNWENDGFEIKEISNIKYPYLKGNLDFVLGGQMYFFKPGYTWSSLTSGNLGIRKFSIGCLFDAKGQCFFPSNMDIGDYLMAFYNSVVFTLYSEILAPTLDFNSGVISRAPILYDKSKIDKVTTLANKNVSNSQADWDSFENSWEFKRHPLMRSVSTVAEAFAMWEKECNDRFNQLKANEEELNRIFINIYELQDELTPEVEDKDITVRKADLQRDIKSLISYAVGCMFGRYSLDKNGLIFAGGDFDDVYWCYKGLAALDKQGQVIEGGYAGISLAPYHYAKFRDNDDWESATPLSFEPDMDNIISICDDEYFPDDIVGRFMKFIETVYGYDTLEENLKFIADALGGKGMPRDVIRNYFLNDFYADHCKIYQKRPIYWLFDSGKKNGFKALIYMHRYQPDTIARMRTDYVHEQQERYRTAIVHLEQRINNASTSERVKLNKQMGKLQDQATEIRTYEEKIHHLADQMIRIDLDDGVNHNYEIFKVVLAKIK